MTDNRMVHLAKARGENMTNIEMAFGSIGNGYGF